MSQLRIVAISDTHNRHSEITVPECDLLLHAGDFTLSGSSTEVERFARWFDTRPAIEHVAIPGNHDWYCERESEAAQKLFSDLGSHLLIDQTVEVLGLKIFGSPWSPWFHSWAFNFPKIDPNHSYAREHWAQIPDDTDIILTHGPPYQIVDKVDRPMRSGEDPHKGCPALLDRIKQIKPKLVVVGHIHEGFGMNITAVAGTVIVNAANCTFPEYNPDNPPIGIGL